MALSNPRRGILPPDRAGCPERGDQERKATRIPRIRHRTKECVRSVKVGSELLPPHAFERVSGVQKPDFVIA
jgi:hypothetical protein